MNVVTLIRRTELLHFRNARPMYQRRLVVSSANNDDISADVTFDPARGVFDYYIYSDGMLVQRSIPNSPYNLLRINDRVLIDTSGNVHRTSSTDGFDE